MSQKDRHLTPDVFIADFSTGTLKDDQASMEHPFFSLSKKPDLAVRHYQHNNRSITITPSVMGMPTIWDKDILIYCCSQLIEGMKRGREPQQTVHFQVYNFLVSTNRNTGGKAYDLLKDALDRLRSVNIRTNIKTGGREITDSFGFIEWWHMVEEAASATVGLKLSDWFHRAVTNYEVLTLDRDYFCLNGGIERRVYELCRKHCGNQERWSISLDLLHKKCGSHGPLRRFRMTIKQLAISNQLPEYWLRYDRKSDCLTSYPRSNKGGFRQIKDVLGIK